MAQRPEQASISKALEVATFAAGCFWCTEAVFDQLKGVVKVTSGYSGGKTPNPSYEEVCTGDTGHAESIEITFDPSIISFKDLLQIFFTTSLEETDSHRGCAISRVLQGGRLSSGLLRKELPATLLPCSDRAEDCQVARALSRETQAIIGNPETCAIRVQRRLSARAIFSLQAQHV